MKENFEDEVITLADGKTANNLRGAALAGIGISDKDCKLWSDPCTKDSECCSCKFSCLKLATQPRAFQFISFSILYENLFCNFSDNCYQGHFCFDPRNDKI
jgi:hypothetical protein